MTENRKRIKLDPKRMGHRADHTSRHIWHSIAADVNRGPTEVEARTASAKYQAAKQASINSGASAWTPFEEFL